MAGACLPAPRRTIARHAHHPTAQPRAWAERAAMTNDKTEFWKACFRRAVGGMKVLEYITKNAQGAAWTRYEDVPRARIGPYLVTAYHCSVMVRSFERQELGIRFQDDGRVYEIAEAVITKDLEALLPEDQGGEEGAA